MIRPYRPEDLPSIMDIGNRAWRGIYKAFHEVYGDELFALTNPHPDTQKGLSLKAYCQANPDWTLICQEKGRIVGFIRFSLHYDTKIGQFHDNAVDPDCKLKGIGQQMYQAAFDRFRQEGMRYAMVCTGNDEGHARAVRAYERAGFNIKCAETRYFKKL